MQLQKEFLNNQLVAVANYVGVFPFLIFLLLRSQRHYQSIDFEELIAIENKKEGLDSNKVFIGLNKRAGASVGLSI